jgi:hypothetical protein
MKTDLNPERLTDREDHALLTPYAADAAVTRLLVVTATDAFDNLRRDQPELFR